MEINLRTDDLWMCKVSLRQKYTFYPAEALGKDTTQKTTPGRSGSSTAPRGASGRSSAKTRSSGQARSLFENFIAREAKDYDFKEVEDPEQLQMVLEWAQLATLHPSEDYRNYIPDENGNTIAQFTGPKLKFSPNIVRLDVSCIE